MRCAYHAPEDRLRTSVDSSVNRGVKDLLALVAAQPKPARWWVHLVLGPDDAEPTGYNTDKTEHQLSISLDAHSNTVRLIRRGQRDHDDPKEPTFEKMLQRFEKATGVTYRLDRAYLAGTPALKTAVRAFLKATRPGPAAAGSLEALAAARGVKEKEVRSWVHALEGGAGYDAKFDAAKTKKLLAAPHLTDVAREYLGGLKSVPDLSFKKAFKRTLRLAWLLIHEGDDRSAPIVAKVHALAKGDASYDVGLMYAVASHRPASPAWKPFLKALG